MKRINAFYAIVFISIIICKKGYSQNLQWRDMFDYHTSLEMTNSLALGKSNQGLFLLENIHWVTINDGIDISLGAGFGLYKQSFQPDIYINGKSETNSIPSYFEHTNAFVSINMQCENIDIRKLRKHMRLFVGGKFMHMFYAPSKFPDIIISDIHFEDMLTIPFMAEFYLGGIFVTRTKIKPFFSIGYQVAGIDMSFYKYLNLDDGTEEYVSGTVKVPGSITLKIGMRL